MINVGGELGSDAGYFSTSPQIAYQPRTPTTAQQLTPQTPTIILTGNYLTYLKIYIKKKKTNQYRKNLLKYKMSFIIIL